MVNRHVQVLLSTVLRSRVLTAMIAVLSLGATPAAAQGAPEATGPGAAPALCKPWVCSVSSERQERATELYEDGNQLYKASLFTGAAARYRAALSYWDHPAIHYNLALAQIGLDRPLDAFRSLEAALRYQGQALESEVLDQASAKLASLRERISEVHVVCDEPGAAVTLDGKPLFTGPGETKHLVLVGEHQIDARKPGYVTASKQLDLTSGTDTTVTLTLIPERDAIHRVRKWRRWLPWTIATVGAATTGIGLVLHRQSNTTYADFIVRFRAQCPNGCAAYPPGLESLYDRARRQQGLAYGAYVGGGLAVLVGLSMVYLNRERLVENRALRDLVRLSVTPVVSEDLAGVVASGSF